MREELRRLGMGLCGHLVKSWLADNGLVLVKQEVTK